MYIEDELNIGDSVFIAPNTSICGKVSIGDNSSVWFQSVLRGDVDEIIIGDNCNIQDGCIIHCVEGFPAKIGNNISLGHGVILHGCTLGNNILVGMRATILTGAIIGNNCLIAAGAVVSENMIIPDNSLVVGIPAKVKKEINESQLKLIYKTAENYVEYSKMYLKKYAK
jgi:carbonic anhydrase/acetyltransferase-like protein (isoleucine patch superfamily)